MLATRWSYLWFLRADTFSTPLAINAVLQFTIWARRSDGFQVATRMSCFELNIPKDYYNAFEFLGLLSEASLFYFSTL
jgi:hypothetical protein